MKILKFAAPWCGPCGSIKPFFKTLKEQFPTVEFEDYNIDETEVHLNYDVMSVPTVILMDGEKEITRYMGAKTLEEYKDLFQKALDEDSEKE